MRQAKLRKQHRRECKNTAKGSMFVNNKKTAFLVGAEILNNKDTKIKSGGFVTIRVSEGKRAWAKVVDEVPHKFITKDQAEALKDRAVQFGVSVVRKSYGAVKRFALQGSEMSIERALATL